MSEKIEPALSVEEWRDVQSYSHPSEYEDCASSGKNVNAYLIALNNAALPEGDQRKITREHVNRLRAIAEAIRAEHSNWDAKAFLNGLADALESYLPPEGA